MADSNALRSRRKRGHAAGDHSLCRHRPQPGVVPPPPDPGDDFDPAAEMRALAGRLAAAYAADTSNTALARELRVTLLALGPGDGMPEMDPELRALFESFR